MKLTGLKPNPSFTSRRKMVPPHPLRHTHLILWSSIVIQRKTNVRLPRVSRVVLAWPQLKNTITRYDDIDANFRRRSESDTFVAANYLLQLLLVFRDRIRENKDKTFNAKTCRSTEPIARKYSFRLDIVWRKRVVLRIMTTALDKNK